MGRDDFLVWQLTKAWTKVIEPLFEGRTYCIEATKVAGVCLSRMRVGWKPLPCAIIVGNDEAWKLRADHVPIPDWPPSAWTVGVDPDHDPGGPGWNGHLISVGDGWVADFSAAQFRRRGLIVCHAWSSEVPSDWDRVDPIVIRNEEAGTNVCIVPRPELAAWRNTSAWRADVPVWMVDKILDEMTSVRVES